MSRPCLQLRAINDRRAYRSINMQSSWFAAPRSSDFTGGFDDCSSRHLGRGASPSGQDSERCRDLVGQAESIALADLNEPLHISALCRTLAVSERSFARRFTRLAAFPHAVIFGCSVWRRRDGRFCRLMAGAPPQWKSRLHSVSWSSDVFRSNTARPAAKAPRKHCITSEWKASHGDKAILASATPRSFTRARCAISFAGEPRLAAVGHGGKRRSPNLSLLCVPCRAVAAWEELAVKYEGHGLREPPTSITSPTRGRFKGPVQEPATAVAALD